MIHSRKKIGLCLILIVINLAFIWGNSLMSAPVSSAISEGVQEVLTVIFGSEDSPPAESDHFLRKLAHFTEFTSLGLLCSWLAAMLQKKFQLPFLCGFLAACTDEFIQRFVPGRGPSIWDVGIDSSGVILGCLLFWLGSTLYKKYKMKLLEDTTQ